MFNINKIFCLIVLIQSLRCHFEFPDAKQMINELLLPPVLQNTVNGLAATLNKSKCIESVTRFNGGHKCCRNDLIFYDDFRNQKSLFDKWNVQQYIPYSPDFEFVSYQNRNENLCVKNGILYIEPTLLESISNEDFVRFGTLNLNNGCTREKNTKRCFKKAFAAQILPPIVSAKITSNFSFKYGKITVRAKFPIGDWIYPQLYLDPTKYTYGKNFEFGRIWLAFSRGNFDLIQKNGKIIDSRLLQAGLIFGQSETLRNYGIRSKYLATHWNNAFHNYTLIWKPDRVILEVDNEQYGIIFPPPGGFSTLSVSNTDNWNGNIMAPFNQEFNISFGIGVGGSTNFPDDEGYRKPWRNKGSKSILNFWMDRNKWFSTWDGINCGLQISSIKIWAI